MPVVRLERRVGDRSGTIWLREKTHQLDGYRIEAVSRNYISRKRLSEAVRLRRGTSRIRSRCQGIINGHGRTDSAASAIRETGEVALFHCVGRDAERRRRAGRLPGALFANEKKGSRSAVIDVRNPNRSSRRPSELVVPDDAR